MIEVQLEPELGRASDRQRHVCGWGTQRLRRIDDVLRPTRARTALRCRVVAAQVSSQNGSMVHWSWLVALLVGTTGCLQADLVQCAGGLACPAGSMCNEPYGCERPEQLVACADLADGTGCSTSAIVGGCFGGICLPRGCGNHVMESDELCDDGNQASGDGCRGDCRSEERCGDGVADLGLGEQCDDANAVSRDGCDSRCSSEDRAWTATLVAPAFEQPRRSTYDPMRGRFVHVASSGVLWEWDGVAWTANMPTAVPTGEILALVFDPDRSRLVLVAAKPPYSVALYEWVQGGWQARTTTTSPNLGTGSQLRFTYDQARNRLFAVASGGGAWAITASGTTWLLVAVAPASFSWGGALAYDPSTQHVLLAAADDPDSSALVWDYDGTTWTNVSPLFPLPSSGFTLAYDATRGHLLLMGGDQYSVVTTVYGFTGGSWSIDTTATLAHTAANFDAAYDSARQRLVTFAMSLTNDVYELGTSWTAVAGAAPSVGLLAADPTRHGFVVLERGPWSTTVAGATWKYDTQWTRQGVQAPATAPCGSLTYDPIRGAIVAILGTGGMTAWELSSDQWTQLPAAAIAGSCSYPPVLAFDPIQQQMLALGPGGLQALAPDRATWSTLGPSVGANNVVTSLAWDPESSVLIATLVDGILARAPMGWDAAPLPAAGSQWRAVTDLRAGETLLIGNVTTAVWSRTTDGLAHIDDTPLVGTFSNAYDSTEGRLLLYGVVAGSYITVVRTLTSATPLESCAPGEDLDGDGLAGCADPECFWTCSTCYPYTSCP